MNEQKLEWELETQKQQNNEDFAQYMEDIEEMQKSFEEDMKNMICTGGNYPYEDELDYIVSDEEVAEAIADYLKREMEEEE